MDDAALQASEALADALCTRERELLAILVRSGGHARQRDLVEALDIGRNQVSCYVRDLADAGHLQKVTLGRENVLFLPGCEPEILQPTLGEAVHQ